jgi:hypothetical protein
VCHYSIPVPLCQCCVSLSVWQYWAPWDVAQVSQWSVQEQWKCSSWCACNVNQYKRAYICTIFLHVLKGQCHEIFDFWFFSWNSFPQAHEYTTISQQHKRNWWQNLPSLSLRPVANLPPVSLKLVMHLVLRISPRISEKNLDDPNVIFRGLGKGDSWKKTWSKKSRDTVPLIEGSGKMQAARPYLHRASLVYTPQRHQRILPLLNVRRSTKSSCQVPLWTYLYSFLRLFHEFG